MPGDLADPITFGLLAAPILARAGIRCALYGGLALGVYGRARLTADADFAVAAVDAGRLVAAFAAAGLHAEANFDALPHGGLLLARATVFGRGEWTGSNVIDVVAPRDAAYAELALDRSLPLQLRGTALAILAPEDFVVFKALSDRPIDIEDAASVLVRMGPDLDLTGIEQQVSAASRRVKLVDVWGRWTQIQQRARELG